MKRRKKQTNDLDPDEIEISAVRQNPVTIIHPDGYQEIVSATEFKKRKKFWRRSEKQIRLSELRNKML